LQSELFRVTGLVQGNGTALANAQVRIDATPFTTNTASDGTFTLTTVPAGSGYLLKVSAAGFASKPVPGITVTSGTTDLGTITLGITTGPYQTIPLAPDVNPTTTTVEQGGTAYRYYLMQNSAGQPQGGAARGHVAAVDHDGDGVAQHADAEADDRRPSDVRRHAGQQQGVGEKV